MTWNVELHSTLTVNCAKYLRRARTLHRQPKLCLVQALSSSCTVVVMHHPFQTAVWLSLSILCNTVQPHGLGIWWTLCFWWGLLYYIFLAVWLWICLRRMRAQGSLLAMSRKMRQIRQNCMESGRLVHGNLLKLSMGLFPRMKEEMCIVHL